MESNGTFQKSGTVVLVCAVAAVLAFGITAALIPVQLWLEAKFGMMSFLHLGPGRWFFMATYVALLASAWRIRKHYLLKAERRKKGERTKLRVRR